MSATTHRVDYFGTVRPCAGFRQSGDAVVLIERDGLLLAVVVDVLGHGPGASDVAIVAEQHLQSALPASGPVALIRGLNQTLKGTRGAAVGVAVIDVNRAQLSYAGVGNTVLRRFGAGTDRLVSMDGIVGASFREPREQRMVLSKGDIIFMHSDGVKDRFEMSEQPSLKFQSAEIIANTIMKQFSRDYDDAACIIVRYDP